FGCDAVEDAHHLFMECGCYKEWRLRAASELEKRANKKLADSGVEEATRKSLLVVAKSLFTKNDTVWPLKHSFYYLGHLPPLEPLLPTISI
ncbi:hypothetical protein B0H19DRAFT_917432, partial [Mycena capillaripes]